MILTTMFTMVSPIVSVRNTILVVQQKQAVKDERDNQKHMESKDESQRGQKSFDSNLKGVHGTYNIRVL